MLYVTDHCTLCDEAFALLAATPEAAGQTLQLVDIANLSHDYADVADELVEKFGPNIPLLTRLSPSELLAATEQETSLSQQSNSPLMLCWPFATAQLVHWLAVTNNDAP